MSEAANDLKRLQVPMSDAARKRIKARAIERGFDSSAAYIRSFISVDIPELKSEFDELEEWGGDRTQEKA